MDILLVLLLSMGSVFGCIGFIVHKIKKVVSGFIANNGEAIGGLLGAAAGSPAAGAAIGKMVGDVAGATSGIKNYDKKPLDNPDVSDDSKDKASKIRNGFSRIFTMGNNALDAGSKVVNHTRNTGRKFIQGMSDADIVDFEDSREAAMLRGAGKMGGASFAIGRELAGRVAGGAKRKIITPVFNFGLDKVYTPHIKPKLDTLHEGASNVLNSVSGKLDGAKRTITGFVTTLNDEKIKPKLQQMNEALTTKKRQISGFVSNYVKDRANKYKQEADEILETYRNQIEESKSTSNAEGTKKKSRLMQALENSRIAQASQILERYGKQAVGEEKRESRLMNAIRSTEGYRQWREGINEIKGANGKSILGETFTAARGTAAQIASEEVRVLEQRRAAREKAKNDERILREAERLNESADNGSKLRYVVINGGKNLSEMKREPVNSVGIGMVFNDINVEQKLSRFTLAEGSVNKATMEAMKQTGLNTRQKMELKGLLDKYVEENRINNMEDKDYLNSVRDEQFYHNLFKDIVSQNTGLSINDMYSVAQKVSDETLKAQHRERLEAAEIANEKFNLDEENLRAINELIENSPNVQEKFNSFVNGQFEHISDNQKNEIKQTLVEEIMRNPESATNILGKEGVKDLKEAMEKNKAEQEAVYFNVRLNQEYKENDKFAKEHPEITDNIKQERIKYTRENAIKGAVQKIKEEQANTSQNSKVMQIPKSRQSTNLDYTSSRRVV